MVNYSIRRTSLDVIAATSVGWVTHGLDMHWRSITLGDWVGYSVASYFGLWLTRFGIVLFYGKTRNFFFGDGEWSIDFDELAFITSIIAIVYSGIIFNTTYHSLKRFPCTDDFGTPTAGPCR